MLVDRKRENYFKIWFLDEYMSHHKGYIAGGCFKNIFSGDRVKDIDVFFRCRPEFDEAVAHFLASENYHLYYENDNVVAYKHNKSGITVELCKKVFGEARDMISNFDFTVTKFAYYKAVVPDDENPGETKIEYRVVCDDMYFEHLQLKRLVTDDKILYPMSTFERMIRYIRYGYMPCTETKLRIARAIHNLPSDPMLNSRSLYDGID